MKRFRYVNIKIEDTVDGVNVLTIKLFKPIPLVQSSQFADLKLKQVKYIKVLESNVKIDRRGRTIRFDKLVTDVARARMRIVNGETIVIKAAQAWLTDIPFEQRARDMRAITRKYLEETLLNKL